MAVRITNSCKDHVWESTVPQLECREFAERAFQRSEQSAANLDAGSWNVGNMITDKKDRQAILHALHLSV